VIKDALLNNNVPESAMMKMVLLSKDWYCVLL
jgi:hypothetical protein